MMTTVTPHNHEWIESDGLECQYLYYGSTCGEYCRICDRCICSVLEDSFSDSPYSSDSDDNDGEPPPSH